MTTDSSPQAPKVGRSHPFRRAVLRGLAIVLPPLLTIVIFLWIGSTINHYVLRPAKWMAREALVWVNNDTVTLAPGEAVPQGMKPLPSKVGGAPRQAVPTHVYDAVAKHPSNQAIPSTGEALYRMYVDLQYLRPTIVVPVFTCIFILVMYLLGKTMAAGIGAWVVETTERVIQRIPVIRNVYSSVKQVTDFVFSQRSVEYTRVVAIEYPRKGIWSLGMVTGESMADIRSAANEPLLSVLIPTSPAPFTGFTITIKKSEAIDLNLTIDQAFQFIVSCGVVVPPQQQHQAALESQVPPTDSVGGEAGLPTTAGS
ncbi:MAG: DUF502 domain-containing protein [Planctomycetota bacterium]|nr:MAG: DUF502 domain-containing protein [Planctomycetota bacterium]REJ87090.1 MAG: DUF502 domain-containing protein [Planctomycetota bacterium]REK26992.1 MAG: DUF502 domain-containing protein [Planctomycetota bacterium]REK47281.1 MAG: DUF502 domain-containing protein [Planctomycetota bacterium]